MRDVIAVTEYPSMRGRYKATVKRVSGRVFEVECGHGPEAAAAKATELAINGSVIILADKSVMNLIPTEYGGCV